MFTALSLLRWRLIRPRYEAGLRTGDVITELNRQPVRNAQDAITDTDKPISSQTLVKVWTKGGSHYLTVDESTQS